MARAHSRVLCLFCVSILWYLSYFQGKRWTLCFVCGCGTSRLLVWVISGVWNVCGAWDSSGRLALTASAVQKYPGVSLHRGTAATHKIFFPWHCPGVSSPWNIWFAMFFFTYSKSVFVCIIFWLYPQLIALYIFFLTCNIILLNNMTRVSSTEQMPDLNIKGLYVINCVAVWGVCQEPVCPAFGCFVVCVVKIDWCIMNQIIIRRALSHAEERTDLKIKQDPILCSHVPAVLKPSDAILK